MKKILLATALILGISTMAIAETGDEWFAIATGLWKTNNGRDHHARASWAGPYDTEQEAKNEAVAECKKTGRNCKVATTWNGGCGWVTTGKLPGAAAGVSWGAGPTKEAALRNCENSGSGGYVCNEPIGACGSGG